MSEFQTPPDPAGSPLEKLVVTRRFPARREFAQYLREQGVDPDNAEKMGRAVDEWERDLDYHRLAELGELELWANIHSHPGSGSGGPTPPSDAIFDFDARELSLSDTDPVSTWPDRASPSLGDLVQKGTTSVPTYAASDADGKPGVYFDGSSCLEVAFADIAHPVTIFIVSTWDSGTYIIQGQQASGLQFYYVVGEVRMFAGSVLGYAHTRPIAKSLWGLQYNSTDSFLRYNEVEQAAGDVGTNALRGITVGAAYNATGFSTATVHKILGYDRILTAQEITDTETSLNNDWFA